MIALWLLPIAAVGWVIWTYNRLIKQRNVLAEAWSGIDVQLKRRHDLVPLLANTVQGYSKHERSAFETVARARTAAQGATSAATADRPEQELSAGLKQLLVLAEAYPELKATANFQQLSQKLVETEDQIQFARRYYNGAARDMNNLVESFPSNLIARPMGFSVAAFFTLESVVERTTPEVRL